MKIFARNSTIVELTKEEAEQFLDSYHSSASLKGYVTKQIGLVYRESLVAVLQLGQARTAGMRKRYSEEIYRLAFKKDVRVVGGASKLIKHYIQAYKPSDFFTYQDTSGEATDVYDHAGMVLVSQAPKKQYLVAPGKTIATGTRKEVLGMAYATRYGPDRILRVKLGEIFRDDGNRKSNKDIFIEDLGWHIEETTGDRVYEWINPERTFYTYKITSPDSDKYYYGVSHVKKANATEEDCQNDGYFGSGGGYEGNKFYNWKTKHRDNLKKEIIATYPRKMEAFVSELQLVGELWKSDVNCLNSTAGGRIGGTRGSTAKISLQECATHGLVKYQGGVCRSCVANESVKEAFCATHGISKHRGDKCFLCRKPSTTVKVCIMHGSTAHAGGKCMKCSQQEKMALKNCKTHGDVMHLGETCATCTAQKSIIEKLCPTHGMTKFQGNKCSKCTMSKTTAEIECSIHGKTKAYLDQQCRKCVIASNFTEKICSIHGLSKHRKNTCQRCVADASYVLTACETHGETKHSKKTMQCRRCLSAKSNKK